LRAWRPLLLLSRHDAVASLDTRIADLIGGEDPQLLLMLQRYLERVEDVSAISASFHIHRTTFYSRVNRVQKKYDLDWEDAEDRLLTIIGIRIGLLYALHR
jgi:sugar diacid utilization regulator